MTGSRKWDESGDALIRERKERKAAVHDRLATEAERPAADRSADAVGVIRIKTDDAQRDLIISEGVTPLESAACSSGQTSGTSLVAGNVTGGGGKATRKTT
jgi:hypothetical protein